MPRVAALVMSYNDAATIAEAVQSIVRQPRSQELAAFVLSDDASSDDSIARARAAAGALSLTVLSNNENTGERRNLNRSLSHLADRADWVVIVHADDVAADGWLDAMLDRIDSCAENVASICSSWHPMYNGRVVMEGEQSTDPVRVIAGTTQAVHDTLMNGCWWKLSGAALRLRAFREVGHFEPDMPQCGDWEWLLRALSNGWSFEYLPRPYVLYRQHATSVSAHSLRGDVDIAETMMLADRYGDALSRGDIVRFHGRRAYYVLRRMAGGLLRRDARRVRSSFGTWRMLARHLVKQLAS